MPLKIEKIIPHVAFAVEYQRKIIPMFFCYDQDLAHRVYDGWYTADKNEGVRDGQTKKPSVLGHYGYTDDDERDAWYFCTHLLFNKMKGLPEFADELRPHAFQWDDNFIVQTAINNGLLGFDEDNRPVDTTQLEIPIRSCTGGTVYPYDLKEVSNG
tara:strand:- start:250 stop:717 length:468 start_codon:yes stop_codon:yes gene_type:complete